MRTVTLASNSVSAVEVLLVGDSDVSKGCSACRFLSGMLFHFSCDGVNGVNSWHLCTHMRGA